VASRLIFRYFPRKIDVLVALIEERTLVDKRTLVDERTLVEEGREVHAVPGVRGDAARLEVAADTFAVVLLYQENLCRLSGHQLDPDAVAELIAHSLV
jgi:AcrR family transcriptional regulator